MKLQRTSIQFRNSTCKNLKSVSNVVSTYEYIPALDTSWFRCYEGKAKGYGLMIQKIQLTGNLDGWNRWYKAKMWYNDCNTNELETAPIWLHLNRDNTFEDLQQFIRDNKSQWVA